MLLRNHKRKAPYCSLTSSTSGDEQSVSSSDHFTTSPPYPLDRWLGGLQSWSRHGSKEKKILLDAGTELWSSIPQPVTLLTEL